MSISPHPDLYPASGASETGTAVHLCEQLEDCGVGDTCLDEMTNDDVAVK